MGHSELSTLAKYVAAADKCPAWLADLYMLPESASEMNEKMPPSIIFPKLGTTTALQ